MPTYTDELHDLSRLVKQLADGVMDMRREILDRETVEQIARSVMGQSRVVSRQRSGYQPADADDGDDRFSEHTLRQLHGRDRLIAVHSGCVASPRGVKYFAPEK